MDRTRTSDGAFRSLHLFFWQKETEEKTQKGKTTGSLGSDGVGGVTPLGGWGVPGPGEGPRHITILRGNIKTDGGLERITQERKNRLREVRHTANAVALGKERGRLSKKGLSTVPSRRRRREPAPSRTMNADSRGNGRRRLSLRGLRTCARARPRVSRSLCPRGGSRPCRSV